MSSPTFFFTFSGNILTSFGLGECQLSEAEGALAEDTVDNYITLLREFSVGYKKYQELCRKLESRRLDYDAKYKRLQKAKKEDPEIEQCVQAAKVKYEETELDVVTSMISLQGTEVRKEERCAIVTDWFLVKTLRCTANTTGFTACLPPESD